MITEASRRAKARYRERNREKLRAASRERYIRFTPEQMAQRAEVCRRWRQVDPARSRKYNARRDPAKLREYAKRWAAVNQPRRTSAESRRRAAKFGNGPVDRIDRLAVAERDGWICQLCTKPVEQSDLHIDHRIPLSRGGTHTWDNVQATHAFCNMSKKDKLIGCHPNV